MKPKMADMFMSAVSLLLQQSLKFTDSIRTVDLIEVRFNKTQQKASLLHEKIFLFKLKQIIKLKT